MEEVRCTNCNKMLYKYERPKVGLVDYNKKYNWDEEKEKIHTTGRIEIRCPRCKIMNR